MTPEEAKELRELHVDLLKKQKQKELLTEIMNADAKDGLYEDGLTAVEWFFKWMNDHPEATHEQAGWAFKYAKYREQNQQIAAWRVGASVRTPNNSSVETLLTTRLSNSSDNIQIVK